jgi:hypothetical protein
MLEGTLYEAFYRIREALYTADATTKSNDRDSVAVNKYPPCGCTALAPSRHSFIYTLSCNVITL